MDDADFARRAQKVRLVITDNDGVLTDAGVYYSERGEELKRFSMRDGMGVERLRNAGITTVVVTREAGGAIVGRARKLALKVHLGVLDKAAALPAIAQEHGVDESAIAYIGDDVNDLAIMTLVARAGVTGAPSDAMAIVLEVAHYRCRLAGGQGAFREFAEAILAHRG